MIPDVRDEPPDYVRSRTNLGERRVIILTHKLNLMSQIVLKHHKIGISLFQLIRSQRSGCHRFNHLSHGFSIFLELRCQFPHVWFRQNSAWDMCVFALSLNKCVKTDVPYTCSDWNMIHSSLLSAPSAPHLLFTLFNCRRESCWGMWEGWMLMCV